MCGVFVESTSHRADTELLITDEDGYFCRTDWNTAAADSSKHSPPVWVCACPGSFHQQRCRDRSGDLKRFGPIFGLLNSKPDDVLHSLAIADNLFGKRLANLQQCSFELALHGPKLQSTCSGGQEQHGIVRGCVTIDRDRVEAIGASIAQGGPQLRRRAATAV